MNNKHDIRKTIRISDRSSVYVGDCYVIKLRRHTGHTYYNNVGSY